MGAGVGAGVESLPLSWLLGILQLKNYQARSFPDSRKLQTGPSHFSDFLGREDSVPRQQLLTARPPPRLPGLKNALKPGPREHRPPSRHGRAQTPQGAAQSVRRRACSFWPRALSWGRRPVRSAGPRERAPAASGAPTSAGRSPGPFKGGLSDSGFCFRRRGRPPRPRAAALGQA